MKRLYDLLERVVRGDQEARYALIEELNRLGPQEPPKWQEGVLEEIELGTSPVFLDLRGVRYIRIQNVSTTGFAFANALYAFKDGGSWWSINGGCYKELDDPPFRRMVLRVSSHTDYYGRARIERSAKPRGLIR